MYKVPNVMVPITANAVIIQTSLVCAPATKSAVLSIGKSSPPIGLHCGKFGSSSQGSVEPIPTSGATSSRELLTPVEAEKDAVATNPVEL